MFCAFTNSQMPKSLNGLLLVGLLLLIPATAHPNVRVQSPKTLTADSGGNILTRDELYFGLSKPGGAKISEAEWQMFLQRVITPRFPEGLTVLDAYGQYLNKKGQLNKEKTKLVILLYQNSDVKNQLIEEIIAKYKQDFHQESVLRVTSSAKVSF